ncbi:MAG: hypothetical protein ACPGC9_00905, partial [Cytophagales bacterium]
YYSNSCNDTIVEKKPTSLGTTNHDQLPSDSTVLKSNISSSTDRSDKKSNCSPLNQTLDVSGPPEPPLLALTPSGHKPPEDENRKTTPDLVSPPLGSYQTQVVDVSTSRVLNLKDKDTPSKNALGGFVLMGVAGGLMIIVFGIISWHLKIPAFIWCPKEKKLAVWLNNYDRTL